MHKTAAWIRRSSIPKASFELNNWLYTAFMFRVVLLNFLFTDTFTKIIYLSPFKVPLLRVKCCVKKKNEDNYY